MMKRAEVRGMHLGIQATKDELKEMNAWLSDAMANGLVHPKIQKCDLVTSLLPFPLIY